MNKKSKLRKLLKKREAIISRIDKDEKRFEEDQRRMEVTRQKNQEKLTNLTHEILGCIDDTEVQAFVNQFAAGLDQVSKNEVDDNHQTADESINEIDADAYVSNDQSDDDYAEKFRQQYGL